MKHLAFFSISLLFLLLLISSCSKESFTTSKDALLTNSSDTLHFDTVFTTTGSVSQFVKIINSNKEGIHVSSVKLAGGSNSAFKINVDGIPGPVVNNIDVAANDSIYVYVTVSINQNNALLPFIVRDSIEISYNNNKQFVQLDAYGRNAHFLRNKVVTSNEIWNNALPYVILDRLTVAPNATLTINKGSLIYIHADAPFIINGTLRVNGEKYDSTRVVFSGDRLDEPYRGFPASFPGLIFSDVSKDNILNYTTIKNAYQAIVIGAPAVSGTKLTLNECIIDNAYEEGIWAVNTSITARNLLVSNCGQNLNLFGGGTYNFTHCTIASFSNPYVTHKKPVLHLSDNYTQNSVVITNPLNATFTNCIFWGEANGFVEKEILIERKGNSGSVKFNSVLWRMAAVPDNAQASGTRLNEDPLFDSINNNQRFYNFRLKNRGSKALNVGQFTGVTLDLDGNPRPIGLPDLGAYEKQ